MSLVAELQRRNVIRMAGLYLVGAWLLVQVASTLFPAFGVPGWALRALVIVLALGFSPAMVFAWVFELTPGGLKRDADVSPETSIAPQTARRMDRIIIVVLLVALAFFAFDRLVLAPRRDAGLVANARRDAGEDGNGKIDRRSVAVLPFVNMSGDPSNEYFSDGISEEILNVLAGMPELKVAARTSSFSFKGKTIEVPAIARELQVRMVLEGSVRKQGDKVRITAQLIDAKTGFHVWSQTYDRKLEDIFAIQDEIARAIGAELKVKMVDAGVPGVPGRAAGGTRDMHAYDLYLRGTDLWHQRRAESLWSSIKLFEQAIKADPRFAQAYAGESLVYSVLPAFSPDISWADAIERSDDLAVHALALDPSLPEAYTALANNSQNRLHRDTTVVLLRRAIALRPSFATAHQWLGNALMSQGDRSAAVLSAERASALDPRSAIIADNHAIVLMAVARYGDANALCRHALEITPDFPGCLQYAGMSSLLTGDFDGGSALLERLAATHNPSAVGQGRALAAAMTGHGDRHALAIKLAALPFNSNVIPGSGNTLEDQMVAAALMMLGERELALDYVERNAAIFGNTMEWAVHLPLMDPIRCEPRFKAVLVRIRSSDPAAAKLCAAGK